MLSESFDPAATERSRGSLAVTVLPVTLWLPRAGWPVNRREKLAPLASLPLNRITVESAHAIPLGFEQGTGRAAQA